MIITCDGCKTSFNLDEHRLKATGTKLRCSSCKKIIVAYPPEPSTLTNTTSKPETENSIDSEEQFENDEISIPDQIADSVGTHLEPDVTDDFESFDLDELKDLFDNGDLSSAKTPDDDLDFSDIDQILAPKPSDLAAKVEDEDVAAVEETAENVSDNLEGDKAKELNLYELEDIFEDEKRQEQKDVNIASDDEISDAETISTAGAEQTATDDDSSLDEVDLSGLDGLFDIDDDIDDDLDADAQIDMDDELDLPDLENIVEIEEEPLAAKKAVDELDEIDFELDFELDFDEIEEDDTAEVARVGGESAENVEVTVPPISDDSEDDLEKFDLKIDDESFDVPDVDTEDDELETDSDELDDATENGAFDDLENFDLEVDEKSFDEIGSGEKHDVSESESDADDDNASETIDIPGGSEDDDFGDLMANLDDVFEDSTQESTVERPEIDVPEDAEDDLENLDLDLDLEIEEDVDTADADDDLEDLDLELDDISEEESLEAEDDDFEDLLLEFDEEDDTGSSNVDDDFGDLGLELEEESDEEAVETEADDDFSDLALELSTGT